MRLLSIPLALLLASLAGCASLPRTGVPRSGEPLWVKFDQVDASYVARERVGGVEHRDSQGNLIGTSSMYQDRVVQQTRLEWHPMQGSQAVDVQDFFRIAGDERVAADIESTRSRGLIINRSGYGLIAAGAAMLLSGYAMMNNPNTGSLVLPAVYGGLLVGGSGYLLTSWGERQMRYDGGVTPEHAQQTAVNYNQANNLQPNPGGDAPTAPQLQPTSAQLRTYTF